MAAALKERLALAEVTQIGQMLVKVWPEFPLAAFIQQASSQFAQQELMQRAKAVAEALNRCLPPDYPQAVALVVASLGPVIEVDASPSHSPFLYLPHVLWVGQFGLAHFEASIWAQYELTQRFTAEFSIRAFIEAYPEAMLAQLQHWLTDDSAHVRRLVSEGTRPRLPWAARLREFQRDPRPVLALLAQLKDDPSLYVRRSVANNLNDISKDHPDLVLSSLAEWQLTHTPEGRWLLRHALRSLLKAGHPQALAVLGVAATPQAQVQSVRIEPNPAYIGQQLRLSCLLHNEAEVEQTWRIDLQLDYQKAQSKTRSKVFRIKTLVIAAQSAVWVSKVISLQQMTTRTHYPGWHGLSLIINGCCYPLTGFELFAAE
jgi:3-methyladenine DNA glycosylase AlkC